MLARTPPDVVSLIDQFMYPRDGYGRISEANGGRHQGSRK